MSTISASTATNTAYKVTADTTGTLVLQTGATPTTAVTIDASQNVGIGTTTMNNKVNITAGSGDGLRLTSTAGAVALVMAGTSENRIQGLGAVPLTFYANNAEAARIDSSGNLLVGGTTIPNTAKVASFFDGSSKVGVVSNETANTANATFFIASNNGSTIGAITRVGSTSAVVYATTSDYRLKENVQPMSGALAAVQQLKPCTYTWKSGGESAQGFIAHELQEVVPDCVVGEKDAVDADGNPKYQQIDTSFLVATLTAAIQELKAELDAVKAQLENK
jgi:hypothetical protein